MRISDWSSDVCSSDLLQGRPRAPDAAAPLNAAAFLCGEGRDRQPMRRTDVHRVPDRTAPRSLAIPLFWMDMVVHLKCRGRVGFSAHGLAAAQQKIGRASCRERVWQYGSISVVAVSLKKNKKQTNISAL